MTLELQHISKSYDGLPVLKNLNLSFQQGQCYCLMSPSGSGKTTLLRILMGLEQADHGLILADGTPQDMSSLPASAVFQEDRLCESFSPIENVAMCAGRSLKAPRIKWELARLLPEVFGIRLKMIFINLPLPYQVVSNNVFVLQELLP